MALSTDYLFTGKVHVFDATTGQKVGFFQIPVSSNTIADIIGVSPLEDNSMFAHTMMSLKMKTPSFILLI